MDLKHIEGKAISILNDLFYQGGIMPYIDKNDKTPAYDGFITLYKTNEVSEGKKNLLGEIKIQVKGKEHVKRKTYPVEIADLKYYKNNGGCLFFVVDVTTAQVYYLELLPDEIGKIFLEDSNAVNKKTKNIPLKELYKVVDVYKFLVGYYCKQKEQYSYNGNWISLNELENIICSRQVGDLKDLLKGSFTIKKNKEGNLSIAPGSLRIYVKIGSAYRPVNWGEIKSLSREQKITIKCKDKTFKDIHCLVTITNDEKTYSLTINHQITIFPNGEKATLNCVLGNQNIDISLLTIDIMKHIVNGEEIYLDKFACFAMKKSSSKLKELKEIRKSFSNFKKVAKILSINSEQIILDEETIGFMNILSDCLLQDKFHDSSGEDEAIAKVYKIGGVDIALYKLQRNGQTRYFDFFNNNLYISTYEDGVQYPMYLMANDFALVTASNINYKKMTERIMNLEFDEFAETCINSFILEGLKAYDQNKNIELLNLLEVMAYKLMMFAEKTNCDSKSIYALNYYQILKRAGKLSASNIKNLLDIVEENNSMWKLAAFTILESKEEAMDVYEQLNSEDQKTFQNFPIWTLYSQLV